MTEEQPADDLTAPPFDGNGQVTADWQVPPRLSVVRRIVAVARILRNVGTSDDGRALEGRFEEIWLRGPEANCIWSSVGAQPEAV